MVGRPPQPVVILNIQEATAVNNLSKSMITDADINMIDYFWDMKGDLERWSEWEDRLPAFEKEIPELIIAWNKYKESKLILDAIIGAL